MKQCNMCYKDIKKVDKYYIRLGLTKYRYCSKRCLDKAVKRMETFNE